MAMKDDDIVLFRIDRKIGLLLLGALALVFGGFAVAQQLTLSTSYPVPSGIYNQLITTGNSGSVPAVNTIFNQNAGNTILVPATNAGGNVGIGTSAPAAKLDVNGSVNIRPNGLLGLGNMSSNPPPAASQNGQIFYNTTTSKFMGYSGGAWSSLGGIPAAMDPGDDLSLAGGNCGADNMVNLKFLGVNRSCFAFLSKHAHNPGGDCGRYEDNGCFFNAATGYVQGMASSGTTWCGYVCFN